MEKTSPRAIELLSPAKDLACGLAAVNHGADAVYIGSPAFGARRTAANSVADIAQLAAYAHRYKARVYVAMNTILHDAEMDEARALAWQLYEAGADALIVQDVGLLEVGLPPVPLHASTQMDNRTAEKVVFLEKCGFTQVVLARETTLEEMRRISAQTSVALEAFVHGALCVSYSGQCYLSCAACGRSANRGECAQYCRLPYDLTTKDGKIIKRNKYLLSLNDLNLSGHLAQLLDAGISSLKIEGRLKDEAYVKNVTAFYRRRLDALLDGSRRYAKSSSGKVTFFFSPDLKKTFARGETTYFLFGRNEKTELSSFRTPKSQGERIGAVRKIFPNAFALDAPPDALHAGDGCCFVDDDGNLGGFRVNKVENGRIFPNEMPPLRKGTVISRNFDAEFSKILGGKTAERRVAVDALFAETPDGFRLSLADEDGTTVEKTFPFEKIPAQNAARADEVLRAQLARLGNTMFALRTLEISLSQPRFFAAAQLNEWRRTAFDELATARDAAFVRANAPFRLTSHPFGAENLTYLANVLNQHAADFYARHGVRRVEPAFEAKPVAGQPVMFAKYCLKYALRRCPKHFPDAEKMDEPLFLRHGDLTLRLAFDCRNCRMIVVKE